MALETMRQIPVHSAYDFYQERKHLYPFRAVAPINSPPPHDEQMMLLSRGAYIVCPFAGVAHWAFNIQADLVFFLEQFPQAVEEKDDH